MAAAKPSASARRAVALRADGRRAELDELLKDTHAALREVADAIAETLSRPERLAAHLAARGYETGLDVAVLEEAAQMARGMRT